MKIKESTLDWMMDRMRDGSERIDSKAAWEKCWLLQSYKKKWKDSHWKDDEKSTWCVIEIRNNSFVFGPLKKNNRKQERKKERTNERAKRGKKKKKKEKKQRL